ncbi:MAG: hypothetical protein IPJ19_18740 [Planctomycetes bacterium]|nr:hypothetical protein [Planctomycetota bacterium]
MFRFQRSANTATGFDDFLTRPRLVHLDTPNDDHELSFVHAHYPMEDGIEPGATAISSRRSA